MLVALVGLGVLISGVAAVLSAVRARDNAKVDAIWKSLELEPTEEKFAREMVDGLPAPALAQIHIATQNQILS